MTGEWLDPDRLTWPCMVCGDERPDRAISVWHRQVKGAENRFPGIRFNVRYCNDRISCATVASQPGVWPRRPVTVRVGDDLEVTAAAVADRAWDTRRELLPSLAVGLLAWLRDEPASVQALITASDEPAQEVIDTCCRLVKLGLARIVVDRCDKERGLHSMPHQGCVLR